MKKEVLTDKMSGTGEPVFIVGCSRTGSTLLQNLLNRYTAIDILSEIHFLTPRWIHKDFYRSIKPFMKLNDEKFADEVINLMYSGKLFGVFWEKIEQRNLDRRDLREGLITSGKDLARIFFTLMETHAKRNGKSILGAKFPVYICYAEKLFEWFKDGLIIHTIRDPRAIFASQYFKRRAEKGGPLKHTIAAIVQFVHISIQFYWAFRVHCKLKDRKNYFLCKYEALIQHPEETLKSICDFLSIPFDPRMLEPRSILNTSFQTEREVTKTFQTSSLNRWKTKLPKVAVIPLELLHCTAMREFGYRKTSLSG